MPKTRRLAAAGALCLAAAAATPSLAAASSVGRWDREYLDATVQGARFEIAAGHQAERRGHSAVVRALGKRFATDHSNELRAVLALDKQLGVKAPGGLSVGQRHEISQFSRHSGAAFDRAYVRVERSDHVQDLKDNDGELGEGTTPAVKAFVTQFLPMYRMHLTLCRQAASQLRVG